MEEIIALLGLTFLWAYLYSKAPESETVSGFVFRLLFLGMTLWTANLLVWSVFSTNSTIEVYKYDQNGTFIGNEIHNSTLAQPIKQAILGYLDALNWITYGIMALIIIFFIYNTFTSILRKGR
jgi:hypothetical protein